MRVLLFALTLSSPAFADIHALAEAKAGGEYVLLTERCSENGQKAYIYLDDGSTEDGCWVADSRTVTIVWEESGKRRYPIEHFNLQKVTTKRVVTVQERRSW